jgi:hypothetical protein
MTGALQAVPFINTLTAYACSSDGRPFEKSSLINPLRTNCLG